VSERIRSAEDPQKTAAILVEAFEIAHVSKEHNVHLYWDLAKTDDPLLYARALSELESYFNPALEGLLGEMQESILYGKIPEVQAQIYKRAEQTLQQYGLSLEVLGKTARGQFVGLISSDESMAGIEKFCSNWKIENEYTQAYGRYLKPGLEAGSMKGIDRSRKPNVTELPELHARLKSFGLDDETVQMIFGSWSSYSAIQKRLYENGDRETITSADIETVVPEQGKQLRRQLTRLTDYAEAYGNDEVKSIIETFGIVNFIRYKPEQLHNQLISWQSGETVAHNIVISARSDWNGAISDAGESFERVFGQDGYFCFEANDSLALARIAVAVGNRERAAGRDPETLNAIDNFVIDAHANPYGLLLGVNGEHLDAVDYVKSSLDERRANTYARHLGNKFRIILKACSTAGEVSYGKNIAESISEHHNVVVAGSKTLTSGSVTIESDGTVIFNGGKEPAVVYDNRE
jgi:hypothetical protein